MASSEPYEKYLNKLVVARFADGKFAFAGRCVACSDVPSVTVNLPNGGQRHWRADMVEVVPLAEEALDSLLPQKGSHDPTD